MRVLVGVPALGAGIGAHLLMRGGTPAPQPRPLHLAGGRLKRIEAGPDQAH